MYHVELREFPHNTHAYNLDAERLHATVLDPMVRGQVFELGDRQWIPPRTKITVLEGEQLPLHALSMGRGWNNARRKGKDVTDEMLAQAAAAVAPDTGTPADEGAPDIPDQIRKLGELRDSGLLSEEEFAAKKAELLERM